jgi:hypothetical protein
VDGHYCDSDDGCKYGGEHDDDEPGGAVCGLRRGLGDPHGVDKGVRDELDELHVSSDAEGEMVAEIDAGTMFLRGLNRKGLACIYRVRICRWGLPERGQAHTLKDV